ncbi:hypothetical protein SAMN05444158_2507 [Bradyrhizobium canariense]|uniref:Uncharacterized protein n=1 Tax=Bradyrhizobium canariense TaxID=255045 RepID=A0A1H1TDQ2_9BRAD|nr:hypothetical protein SAMN05444158_2507 [Bradyrhizobium canariense]
MNLSARLTTRTTIDYCPGPDIRTPLQQALLREWDAQGRRQNIILVRLWI